MADDLKRRNQPCWVCREIAEDETVVTAEAAGVVFVPSRLRREGSTVIAPKRHVATPSALTEDEFRVVWRLLFSTTRAIEKVYNPQGLHTWSDIGALADADGEHYFVTVVPRHVDDGYYFIKPGDLPTVDEESRRTQAAILRRAVRS